MAKTKTRSKTPAQEKTIVEEAYSRFDISADESYENRVAGLADLRFVSVPGGQWPEAIKRKREKARRPCLEFDKTSSFLRQVTNDQRKNTPQIKFRPVDNESDPETAEVLNGLSRNIWQISAADRIIDSAFWYAVATGIGYFGLTTRYIDNSTFDQEIRYRYIENPFNVYLDPTKDHYEKDWGFIVEVISKDDYTARYGDKYDFLEFGEETIGDSKEWWYTDDSVRVGEYWRKVYKPITLIQISNGQKTTVVELDPKLRDWIADRPEITVLGEREAQSHIVEQCFMAGDKVLETREWAGSHIPIVPIIGHEVNIEGRRIFESMHRKSMGAQQLYNFMRTATTELIALAPKVPFIGLEGQFEGHEAEWARANTESFPYLEYKRVDGEVGPPMRQPFAGPAMGALQESLSASDDMKAIMGIFDASLGAQSNEESGVAINARKVESDTSNFHFIDNRDRALVYTGKMLAELIPKVYDTERVVRLLNPDDQSELVVINRLFLDANDLAWKKENDLTVGRYDAVVDTGPSFTTQRQEASNAMVELIRVFPQAAPVLGDILAKNQDWPESDEIQRRLKMLLPPELQTEDEETQIPPQVINQLKQLEAQIQQTTQQAQLLAQENQELKLKNQNKQSDIAAKVKISDDNIAQKDRQLAQKEKEDIREHAGNLTKMELEQGRNVPGALV